MVRKVTLPTSNPNVTEAITNVYFDIRGGLFGVHVGECLIRQYSTFFCQQCAGSHGPNDPCPAAPYFQFNNVPRNPSGKIACSPHGETDNDHLLTTKTWHCDACDTDNDEDKFPGRCSICRRYR